VTRCSNRRPGEASVTIRVLKCWRCNQLTLQDTSQRGAAATSWSAEGMSARPPHRSIRTSWLCRRPRCPSRPHNCAESHTVRAAKRDSEWFSTDAANMPRRQLSKAIRRVPRLLPRNAPLSSEPAAAAGG